MNFKIDKNMHLVQTDIIPEVGSILLDVDTSRNILTAKLLIGYANASQKIDKIEDYFNDCITLNDNMLHEALEDFTYRPAYVLLTRILINADVLDRNNGKDKSLVQLKDILLHEDIDIQYITYCCKDFLNGAVQKSQIYVNSDFIDRNGWNYYFMIDSYLKPDGIQIFVQKAKMMSYLPKHNIYSSKKALIKEFEKAYKLRQKVLMSKKAVVRNYLNVMVPTTKFEKYSVYFRQIKNGTIYTYVCMGKGKDGNDYFLPLIHHTDKEKIIMKLMELEKTNFWIVNYIKKSDVKTLNVKLYDMHCKFLEPNLDNTTYWQKLKLRELELI